MNLSAYDACSTKIDKNKTWIDIKRKKLISREITPRKYAIFVKRYNVKYEENDYFIVLSDCYQQGYINHKTSKDDYGRLKLLVGSIWQETNLCNINKDCNITIKLVDQNKEGEIYKLDV